MLGREAACLACMLAFALVVLGSFYPAFIVFWWGFQRAWEDLFRFRPTTGLRGCRWVHMVDRQIDETQQAINGCIHNVTGCQTRTKEQQEEEEEEEGEKRTEEDKERKKKNKKET